MVTTPTSGISLTRENGDSFTNSAGDPETFIGFGAAFGLVVTGDRIGLADRALNSRSGITKNRFMRRDRAEIVRNPW